MEMTDSDYWRQYALALRALYEIRTRQYHARCQGTVRDTKLETEFIRAAVLVQTAEAALGINQRSPNT